MNIESKKNSAEPSSRYLGKPVHLIGIGGSGMRALAKVLLDHGAIVSGSDASISGPTERLAKRGVTIAIGQRGENLPDPCETVVYSAAINEQNPELLAARQRGLEVMKYSQMLGELMSEKIGLAVAGTHGKSTTTAMIAYVLHKTKADPSFIVGATVSQLGGPSGAGKGKHFVAEACEFDRSFLNLHPQYAAILNLEEDHLDCFRDLDAIIEAFRAFAAGLPPGGAVIANGEDRNVLEAVRDVACDVETFGLSAGCHWRGLILKAVRGNIQLEICKDGKIFGDLLVPLPGLHNAYNALAAVAMLHHAGLQPDYITRHLETFTGTKRRMTHVGQSRGVTVVDDFAHHPTEIQATLRAVKNHYQPKRIFCVFQPHQHSRTRFLLKDFAQSFALAEEVIVPEIYFVRDSEKEKDHISSEDLVAQISLRGGVAKYLETFEDIVQHLLAQVGQDDLIVTMGAGNVWEVADEIIRRLGKNN